MERNPYALRAVSALVAATLLFGLACVSSTTGNEGNLEFSYVTDDKVRDFNKPIAAGAQLDIFVAQAGSSKAVTVMSGKTDKPEVAKVISAGGNQVVVQGVAPGEFKIEVEAQLPDGTNKTDSINMLVRAPEVLKLRHYCTDSWAANYLVDQKVLVGFDMEMTNGQSVIGYGYHPVTIEPATGAILDKNNKDQASLHLQTGSTRQTVTIKSQIDATQMTLGLVLPGDINGASLNSATSPVGGNFVGQKRLMHVRPTVDGTPVCQSVLDMTVTNSTPDVCEVKSTKSGSVWGWVEVTGKKVGKCTFTCTFPQGDGGKGVSQLFSTDVSEIVKP